MRKNLTLLFALCLFTAGHAQTTSKSDVIKKAREDAKKFYLSREQMRDFRQHQKDPNADYFDPTAAYASDPSLLTNPDYIIAFHNEAYKKTKRRHTAAHYILWVAGGTTVLMGALFIGILILFGNEH